MMLARVVAVLILGWFCSLQVAAQAYEWAIGIGGAGLDEGYCAEAAANGDLIIAGVFTSSIDVDPGPATHTLTSNGGFDIFVSRYTALGSLQWAFNIGSTTADWVFEMTLDADDNICIGGWINPAGTIDFDPGPGSSTSTGQTSYYAKYAPDGSLMQAFAFGGNGGATVLGIAHDDAGAIYLTGGFTGFADFDPGPAVVQLTSNGGGDAYLAKFDAAGVFAWAVAFGNSSNMADTGNDVVIDAEGYPIITGKFSGTIDIDPGPGVVNLTDQGGGDFFLARFDPDGNLIWAHGVGGPAADVGECLAATEDGTVVITGTFNGAVDMDPGTAEVVLSAMNDADAFLARYNSAGSLLWAVGVPGIIPSNEGRSVAVVSADTIALSTRYSFGKYTGSGTVIWENSIFHTYDITPTIGAAVYVTGAYETATDFDPGDGIAYLPVFGGPDVFAGRYVDGEGITAVGTANDKSTSALWPNPWNGTGELHAALDGHGVVRYSITTASGTTIAHGYADSKAVSLSFHPGDLPTGTYVITMIGTGGLLRAPLVVLR